MFAAHRRLDNLTVIVDRNGLQIDGPTEKVVGLEPIADKWRAFNWNVICVDGHDHAKLLDAFEEAKQCTDRPTAIIANTVKGKGVSFMEDSPYWHGGIPTPQQFEAALAELEQEARQWAA